LPSSEGEITGGIKLEKSPRYGEPLPDQALVGAKRKKVQIRGKTYTLPCHHWGIWGADVATEDVTLYTDGSLVGTTAAWAVALHDDMFEAHWQTIHEDEGVVQRIQHMNNWGRTWGGKLDYPTDASYVPELEAMVRAVMLMPSTWNLTIVTDNEGVQKTAEEFPGQCSENQVRRKLGWQLLKLLIRVAEARTGTVTVVHQHSHKKLLTTRSVGNALADLKAEQARLT
jgi:hypothetical protein